MSDVPATMLTGAMDPWNTFCVSWDREGYLPWAWGLRPCRSPSIIATGQGPPQFTFKIHAQEC